VGFTAVSLVEDEVVLQQRYTRYALFLHSLAELVEIRRIMAGFGLGIMRGKEIDGFFKLRLRVVNSLQLEITGRSHGWRRPYVKESSRWI
jgi:hypothetical protein